MNDNLISVKDLKKYFNRGTLKALDGVSVDINKGDVMVVIVIMPRNAGKPWKLITKQTNPTPIPPNRPANPARFVSRRRSTPSSIEIAIGGRNTENILFETSNRSLLPLFCAARMTNVRTITIAPTSSVTPRATNISARGDAFRFTTRA